MVARPWISARMGRVPSITAVTQVPDTSLGLPDNMAWEGFSTCCRPFSPMSNTPISLVEP